ncbi:MAG TPA: trypsin-like peptidase domain-containing protein, partial [Candidatus Limnocylindrales bacterium]|nr:trypsin-like peptidase domain-containing protein [Candidatus Limnocylindrales bacterium]
MTDHQTTPDDETHEHDTSSWIRPDRALDAPADASITVDRTPPAPTASFSPAPEPRPDWSRPTWGSAEPTPERWFETGTPAPAVPTQPVAVRRGSGAGTILAASLAAAVLASGGTVVALTASGALDRQVVQQPAGPGQNSTTVKQPVTVDENSAVIDVAAKAGPSVVRIFTEGIDPNAPTTQEQSGVGSGIIFDSNGWILTNRHVVAGANQLTVRLKDGLEYPATI